MYAGDIDIAGVLYLMGTFHDGTVGKIFGTVRLHSIGHQFQTASKAVGPWMPFGAMWAGAELATAEGRLLELDNQNDESSVHTAP
ncbi:MAG TPA: hypothetical protein VKU02_11685 [Gemmataceae bacterium]|nr:hypothetical protein [Gemmataceae bacterium]